MAKLAVPVSNTDHVRGNRNAPLTLLEYGDYECPYCREAFPVVKRIEKRLGKELLFVFRNFPMSQVHPRALPAALAAEAAGAQEKFWEMHDLLYEHQEALSDTDLFRYARSLKLDIKRFGEDMESPQIQNRIRADFLGGARSGVNGTPTFFINGIRHDGDYDFGSLEAALEEQLAKMRYGKQSKSP